MSSVDRKRAIVGGLILTMTGYSPARADEAEGSLTPAPVEVDCGLASLYLLLQLRGYAVDLSALRAHLPPRPAAGYSMMELRDAAGRLGLPLVGVHLQSGDSVPDTPLLAFLNRGGHGHFLVIHPVGHTGRMVQVFDGFQGPVVMDWADLYKSPEWTGLALVPHRTVWWTRIAPAGALIVGLAVALIHVRRKRLQSVYPWSRGTE